jgi:hypothetical protein
MKGRVIVAGLLIALAAGTPAAASWDRGTLILHLDALVLVSGCDGLVTEGGVAPTSSSGVPHAYTHNFIASVDIRGGWRSDPDVADSLILQAKITGTGRDDAGREFRIDGQLTMDSFQADFFATNGNVSIRRDDGSFARGSGVGAWPIVTAGEFDSFFGETLFITASQCQLR